MGKKSVVPQKAYLMITALFKWRVLFLLYHLDFYCTFSPIFFLMSRGRDYLNQAKWNNFDKLLLEASNLNLSEVGTDFFLLY